VVLFSKSAISAIVLFMALNKLVYCGVVNECRCCVVFTVLIIRSYFGKYNINQIIFEERKLMVLVYMTKIFKELSLNYGKYV